MKKALSIILAFVICFGFLAGVSRPAQATGPNPTAIPDTLTQDVIEYMEGLDENDLVPVWITLSSPSKEEIEALVQAAVAEDLTPQKYYEARLRILKDIFSNITSSFAAEFLDDSCSVLYLSHYSAVVAVEAPKKNVLQLGDNPTVIEISLYEDFEIVSEEETKLSEELKDYLNCAADGEMIPLWITLESPSTEEIEAIVRETVPSDLLPEDYYRARLQVIRNLFVELTSSFTEQFLDESCNILYCSRYSAAICVEVPKEKVSELAENSSVVTLDLYSEYDILPEDERLTPELVAYMNDLDDSEIVPIWITLVSPNEEEIEAIVKERVSDDLSPQEYYEARLSVIESIFNGITATFVQDYLDGTCTVLYRSRYSAMLAIEAPKSVVLALSDLEAVEQIDLFAEYEILPETSFIDITKEDYFYNAVLWAFRNGVTVGTDDFHFNPKGVCTRAQVVTFLWRAAGSPEPTAMETPFTDVNGDSYYYKAVLWAAENRITAGTSAEKFSPGAGCTRAQVVTFLWRMAGSPECSENDPSFTDVEASAYYSKAVLWAAENEITAGTSEMTFSPNKTCSRAEIVTFLYRYMN